MDCDKFWNRKPACILRLNSGLTYQMFDLHEILLNALPKLQNRIIETKCLPLNLDITKLLMSHPRSTQLVSYHMRFISARALGKINRLSV